MTADARLAINAFIVGGNPTGLGIYSIKLIRALDEIRNDFFVYASSGGAFGSLRARTGRVPRPTRPDYGGRGDAALMVDPCDAFGLADAMYRTLTDSGLREDLRQRGLRRVSAFTWKRTALEVSRLLDGAFGQSEAHCRALPVHDRA